MLVANLGQPPYTLSQSKKLSYTKATGSNGTASGTSRNPQLLIPTTKPLCTTQQSHDSDSVIKSLSVRITRDGDNCQRSMQTSLITKIPTLNLNLNTVPPTLAHREPDLLHNRSDSIRSEMCHFKPIRTVPTTPPRRFCSNMVRLPKVKRASLLNCDVKLTSKRCSTVLRTLLASPSHKSAFCYMGKLLRKPSFLVSRNTTNASSTAASHKATIKSVKGSTVKEYPIIVSSDDEFYPNNDNDFMHMTNAKVRKTRLKEIPSKRSPKKTQPRRKKSIDANFTKNSIQKKKETLKPGCSIQTGPITRRSVRLSSFKSGNSRACTELLTEMKNYSKTSFTKVVERQKKSLTNDNSRLTTISPRITRSAHLKGIPVILNDGSQIAYKKRSTKKNIL